MPEKHIEKSAKEEEGKKLRPLVTPEKFAKFLVKEFPEEFEKQPGKAREIAFRYSPDRKEMALILHDWMPKAYFKSIDHLLNGKHSYASIAEDLQILEEHGIPPTINTLPKSPASLKEHIKMLEENGIVKALKERQAYRLLGSIVGENLTYVKTNIQALKDRHRDVTDYSRLYNVVGEPRMFNETLNREETIIKKLEEKMPNVPPESIVKLVNKTSLAILHRVLREGTDLRGRPLGELAEADIDTLGITIYEYFGTDKKITNKKLKLESMSDEAYSLSEQKGFDYLMNEKYARTASKSIRLYPLERDAFKEIGEIMGKDRKITGDEIQKKYLEHVGYSPHAMERLGEIVSWLVESGTWKKIEKG